MGCIKSKHRGQAASSSSVEKAAGALRQRRAGEGAAMIHAGHEEDSAMIQAGHEEDSADPALLEYAQRLAEDIVARALRQWAELESRYSDIPYIEFDEP